MKILLILTLTLLTGCAVINTEFGEKEIKFTGGHLRSYSAKETIAPDGSITREASSEPYQIVNLPPLTFNKED